MVAARTVGVHGGNFLALSTRGSSTTCQVRGLFLSRFSLWLQGICICICTLGVPGEFGEVADSTADRGRYFDWVFARSMTRAQLQLDPARYTLRGVLSLASNGISHSTANLRTAQIEARRLSLPKQPACCYSTATKTKRSCANFITSDPERNRLDVSEMFHFYCSTIRGVGAASSVGLMAVCDGS